MNNVNMRKILSMVLFVCLSFSYALIHSMEVPGLTSKMDALGLNAGEYDSDSEDEADYEYKDCGQLELPSDIKSRYLMFYHGSHFSPSHVDTKLDKQDRSNKRRSREIGKAIYSDASYELSTKNGEIDYQILEKSALEVKYHVSSLGEKQRNEFQRFYTNQYKKFISQLKELSYQANRISGKLFERFPFSSDPQIPTSEEVAHPLKYAFGMKEYLFKEKTMEKLSPEYDDDGKPRHPYLGKIYMVLIPESEIEDLDPYFVVGAYANGKVPINIRIINEREVSFSGYIQGKYIVFSVPVRVPSFVGEYKNYYLEKYGMNQWDYGSFKSDFENIKKNSESERMTVEVLQNLGKSSLDSVFKHLEGKLAKHMLSECEKRDISIVYKSFDDGFCEDLPSIEDAKNRRKLKPFEDLQKKLGELSVKIYQLKMDYDKQVMDRNQQMMDCAQQMDSMSKIIDNMKKTMDDAKKAVITVLEEYRKNS